MEDSLEIRKVIWSEYQNWQWTLLLYNGCMEEVFLGFMEMWAVRQKMYIIRKRKPLKEIIDILCRFL